MRVRLAPSPTGTLHIGTARTALFNWLFAHKNQGKFLIRIEDTDKERSREDNKTNILEGLSWLGLNWDEKPIIQSELIESHKKAIQTLLDRGLAYRCYTSEEELEEMRNQQKANGKAPRYDNRHRNLTNEQEKSFKEEGREAVIRFKIEDKKLITWNDLVRGQMTWKTDDLGGDMVIARRTNPNDIGDPLYNLVVVIDDGAMGITHVIRGEDHIANTAKQLLLYQALDLKTPLFAHTPLILNSEGQKLSKRDGVTSISDFREMGYTPEAIANYMALLGWSPPEGLGEIFSLSEASKVFSFDRVNKAGGKFDWDKLNWLNSQVIHSWSNEKLLNSLKSLWTKEGWELLNNEWGIELSELIGPSLIVLNDAIELSRPFFERPVIKEEAIKQLQQEGSKQSLRVLITGLEQNPWNGSDKNQVKNLITQSAESANVKKGLLMKSIRAALLGEMQGPDLLTSWGLLAKRQEDLYRLRAFI